MILWLLKNVNKYKRNTKTREGEVTVLLILHWRDMFNINTKRLYISQTEKKKKYYSTLNK
jgi:hypothetical protein